jgi:hypothetical protein
MLSSVPFVFAFARQLVTVPLTGEARPPAVRLVAGSDRFAAVHVTPATWQPGSFVVGVPARLLPIVTAP